MIDGVYEYEPDEAGNLKVVLESSEGSRKLGDPLDQSVPSDLGAGAG